LTGQGVPSEPQPPVTSMTVATTAASTEVTTTVNVVTSRKLTM